MIPLIRVIIILCLSTFLFVGCSKKETQGEASAIQGSIKTPKTSSKSIDNVIKYALSIQKKDVKTAFDLSNQFSSIKKNCDYNTKNLPNFLRENKYKECIDEKTKEINNHILNSTEFNYLPASAKIEYLESEIFQFKYPQSETAVTTATHYIKVTYNNKEESYKYKDKFCKECVFIVDERLHDDGNIILVGSSINDGKIHVLSTF